MLIIVQHERCLADLQAFGRVEAHGVPRERTYDQHIFVLVAAQIDIEILVVGQQFLIVAVDGDGVLLAELQQLAVEVQQRVRIVLLRCYVYLGNYR